MFLTINATLDYYQIEMSGKPRPPTTFSFKRSGYDFNKIVMGLCNAPATLQGLMHKIFPKDEIDFIPSYLDDLIISSKNESAHSNHS